MKLFLLAWGALALVWSCKHSNPAISELESEDGHRWDLSCLGSSSIDKFEFFVMTLPENDKEVNKVTLRVRPVAPSTPNATFVDYTMSKDERGADKHSARETVRFTAQVSPKTVILEVPVELNLDESELKLTYFVDSNKKSASCRRI